MKKNISLTYRQLSIAENLMLIFLLTLFLTKIVNLPSLVGNMLIAGSGILICLYVYITKGNKKNIWTTWIIAFVFSIMMIVSKLINNNSSYYEILWIWGFIGPALLILYYNIDYKIFEFVYYIVIFIFTINIINGKNINNILYGTSINGISSLLIFYTVLIYYAREKQNKPIIYIPAMISVFFSIWGQGRAGIITSLFFLIAIILYDNVAIKKRKIYKVLRTTIIVCSGLYLIYKLGYIYIQAFINRLAVEGMETGRIHIWSEYITKAQTSLENLLFGVPYSSGRLLKFYQNPHNSFMELHSKFGLFPLIYILFKIFRCCCEKLKNKKYLDIIILLTIIGRSFLDWIAFPGFYDILFWIYIFESLIKRDEYGYEKI